MHEYSICEGLVHAVLEELEKVDPAPARVRSVRVVMGRLHQIVPDYLTSAYEVLTRETPLAGSMMELVVVPIDARCRACGWEGEIEPPFFRCADCGSLDLDILSGRELYLDNIEVEEGENKSRKN